MMMTSSMVIRDDEMKQNNVNASDFWEEESDDPSSSNNRRSAGVCDVVTVPTKSPGGVMTVSHNDAAAGGGGTAATGSKIVTAIISSGTVKEGKYFHTAMDESGRLVFTPNPLEEGGGDFAFLHFISIIIQLTTNGDYYIKCKAEPTDDDITAIFGQECLVQVIKVDAISATSNINNNSSNDNDDNNCNMDHDVISVLTGDVRQQPDQPFDSNISATGPTAIHACTTATPAQHHHSEIMEKLVAEYEDKLANLHVKFEVERQVLKTKIEHLATQKDHSDLRIKIYEEERIILQDRIVEIEYKLHQTNDTLMKEIDFISNKVLLLQEDYYKVCTDKAAIESKLGKIRSHKTSATTTTTNNTGSISSSWLEEASICDGDEDDGDDDDNDDNTAAFAAAGAAFDEAAYNNDNSASRRPSALTRRPSATINETQINFWNQISSSWIAPKSSFPTNQQQTSTTLSAGAAAPSSAGLFTQLLSSRSGSQQQSNSTRGGSEQQTTSSSMHQISKTPFPVVLKSNNNTNAHITYNEYDDISNDNSLSNYHHHSSLPIKQEAPVAAAAVRQLSARFSFQQLRRKTA